MRGFNFKLLTSEELYLLKSGGVGIIPTDTVYGLVTQANNQTSVARLYSLKKRDKKPGTIIASSTTQLLDLGIDQTHIESAKAFWPNPVSVVVPSSDNMLYLHQGVGSLALRVVKDKDLVKLLEITGPLLTSSANHPGKKNANTISEARAYFDDQVDFYINGGDLSNRAPSTIISIDDNKVKVLRIGSGTIQRTNLNK